MSDGSDSTTPGRKGARGWPPADITEPLIEPTLLDIVSRHVDELHQDVRAIGAHQNVQREVMYTMQHNITRIDAKVDGMRTVVEFALQKQARAQRLLVWLSALCTMLLGSMIVLFLLRFYKLIGVV